MKPKTKVALLTICINILQVGAYLNVAVLVLISLLVYAFDQQLTEIGMTIVKACVFSAIAGFVWCFILDSIRKEFKAKP